MKARKYMLVQRRYPLVTPVWSDHHETFILLYASTSYVEVTDIRGCVPKVGTGVWGRIPAVLHTHLIRTWGLHG